MALTDKLTAIANAIRSKTGESEKMTLDQMPTKISSIESGSIPKLQEKSISITANGTTEVTSDSGKDGLSKVNITTDVPSPTLVDKTVELSFPYDPALETNVNMQVTPEIGTAFSSVDISVPSNLYHKNIKEGVSIAGITGTYRDETPKALNHEGINFISWDGTVVETWTLEELATKTVLPEVPYTLNAKTSPLIFGGIIQPESGGSTPSISSALFWNSTLAELKEANAPANVGLCYACDRSGIGHGSKTYPISVAPHIIVLELPYGMELTLSGHYFWDNGLGERGQFTKVSFPAKGQYVLQVRLKTDSDCSNQMITEQMRPYVKAIIFPQADIDKMKPASGLTSPFKKTCIGLMPNPYRNCPNIKTVAISRSGGTVSGNEVSFGDFLGCYSLETISLPVKPFTYNGYGMDIRYMLRRYKPEEGVSAAMSYNLKNIIIPRGTGSVPCLWENCFGSIEAIVFGTTITPLDDFGALNQQYILASDHNIVPWPNLKLIDLSRISFLPFGYLFGMENPTYKKLELPIRKSITIKVPASQLDAYKTANGWKDFADYIVGV